MIIVHLALACFYIEGFEYQENILPRKHREAGNTVYIITSQYSFNKNHIVYERAVGEYINGDKIPVTVLGYNEKYKKLSRMFRIYNGLYDKLMKINPHIIFCHGTQFFSINGLIRYKRNNPDVKVFFDNHGDYVNSGVSLSFKRRLQHRLLWGYIARRAAKISEVIWGVTPLRVKFLQEIYKVNPKKTALLIMGGDDDKIDFKNQLNIRNCLRQKHKIETDDFLIITGGKINTAKNIHLLIEAVKKINNPSVKLVVFGQPDLEMAKEFEEITRSEVIRNIGWIKSEDAYNWFLASDLAVFPGTHSVLWEQACACAIPCVFKFWDGMTHVDVGGNCKFLHNDSIEEIAQTILEIYNNSDLYKKMKKVAVEKGIDYFSYRQIAKRSIEMPQQAAGGMAFD